MNDGPGRNMAEITHMALKNPRIGFTLLLCGPPKMHRPRGITRPISVLTTRITADVKVTVKETLQPRDERKATYLRYGESRSIILALDFLGV